MARAQVVHSDDAVTVIFNGDKRRPEPSTAIVKFPGGHIEVARCSDGGYWAHVQVVDPSNIDASRIERVFGAPQSVTDLPNADLVQKLSVRVANRVPHFDPDA